ncbi:UreF-domain-containing protein [Piptocephalis cylindrospora]|uniref:UreF-domain-containing protein n=1 Tax=Piptocephalis cylindrospora TaxID=1907219 RepID=A0A4P9Y740_9FUNG|nr:UreF-domain-containing protein [Piptocephalis cylindrospora]|eukprot:RKP14041.1 UreF-domain-containing protein [Piptocephalis cylindrospora]
MEASDSKDPPYFSRDDQAETWILYQLADSALPTGGFVVSSGLECLEQVGLLSSLPQFLQSSVDTYARSNLPFVAAAYDANSREALYHLDDIYDAYQVNGVGRRASMAQGLALLNLYCKSYASPDPRASPTPPPQVQQGEGEDTFGDTGRLRAFRDSIRDTRSPGHHAIAFGVTARFWGIRRERVLHAFLFLHARSLLSAAVRLNIVGPYAAQRELDKLRHIVNSLLIECSHLPIDQALTSAPLLDLAQGAHDRLFTRLFNS